MTGQRRVDARQADPWQQRLYQDIVAFIVRQDRRQGRLLVEDLPERGGSTGSTGSPGDIR